MKHILHVLVFSVLVVSTTLVLPERGESQSLGRKCDSGSCVAYDGPSMCVSDYECGGCSDPNDPNCDVLKNPCMVCRDECGGTVSVKLAPFCCGGGEQRPECNPLPGRVANVWNNSEGCCTGYFKVSDPLPDGEACVGMNLNYDDKIICSAGTCSKGVCIVPRASPTPTPPLGSGGSGGKSYDLPCRIPVAITQLPASQLGIHPGSRATFEVVARSQCGVINYQWEFAPGTSTTFAALSGATQPVLVIENVGSNHIGSYRVRVSTQGSASVTAPAQLTLSSLSRIGNPPSINDPAPRPGEDPFIQTQPESRVCTPGGTVSLSASALGTAPLSAQWEFAAVGTTNYVALSGRTGTTLTITGCQSSHQGQYRVRVTSARGQSISEAATVSLLPTNLLTITTQPVGATLRLGQSYTLSVSVSGGNGTPRYQWQRMADNGTRFIDIVNATGAQYAIASFNAQHIGTYRVIARDSTPFSERLSNEVRLALSSLDSARVAAPSFIAPLASQSAPQGSSVRILAQATGATPLSYRWFVNGVENTALRNLSEITVSPTTTITRYAVEVANSYGTVRSNDAEVVVEAAPMFTALLNEAPLSRSSTTPSTVAFGSELVGATPRVLSTVVFSNAKSTPLSIDVTVPRGVMLLLPASDAPVYGPITVQVSADTFGDQEFGFALDTRSALSLNTSVQFLINRATTLLLRVTGSVVSPSPSPTPSPSGSF